MSPEKRLELDREHARLVMKWFDRAIRDVKAYKEINDYHKRAGIDAPEYRQHLVAQVDEILQYLTPEEFKKGGIE